MSCINTTCPYCGVGCGIAVNKTGERTLTLKGDSAHPANAGKLCSKGTHLGETVGLEGRLLHPETDGQRSDWKTALKKVAKGFQDSIAKYGPDSVAFYVSGQILTEDYYVANKLMKGFIGSANIDTNSRLCMASAVAAHVRAFGEDVVPTSYSDLEEASLILLVGSNTAWCHPVIWQRIEAARAQNGAKLVVIDPRRTETADCADLHIPIAPDGDVALFNRLLIAMRERGQIDADFLAQNVHTPNAFWETLRGDFPDMGISENAFAALVDMVANSPKMVTLFSMGANQSVSGTDKGNAIINLHLATGRIGKPGAGPFSMTGQPNAMGGREVGGLASTLAVHMGFSDEECRDAKEFWQSPKIAKQAGLKAVDMFRAVHDGRIKALWVMGTNPAVSMPDAGFVREALSRCPLVVVSDCMAGTDTAKFAHIKLPALAWGEKEGMVTNSERVISRQRKIFDAPGQAKPDWWAMAEVAKHMGFQTHFAYSKPYEIFREFAQQTAFRNDGKRKLDLSQWCDISENEYADWTPWQWGGWSPFAQQKYSHTDGLARLISAASSPEKLTSKDYPFLLNTGRYRDQWHTMTRTGLSARLSQHRREALLEIHHDDAAKYGIETGSLVKVKSNSGQSIVRAQLHDGQRRGELFLPMHWTDEQGNMARANLLPNQAVDPVSHQPGFKRTAVQIELVKADWKGFLASRDKPQLDPKIHWSSSRIDSGWLTEISGMGNIDIAALLPDGDQIEASDKKTGMQRIAVFEEQHLISALYLTRSGVLPEREWITTQFCDVAVPDKPALLAGRPRTKTQDKGPIVCVCFNVGEKDICRAATSKGLTSVGSVGEAIQAGTNCGSCRPAIAKLLESVSDEFMEAAE